MLTRVDKITHIFNNNDNNDNNNNNIKNNNWLWHALEGDNAFLDSGKIKSWLCSSFFFFIEYFISKNLLILHDDNLCCS